MNKEHLVATVLVLSGFVGCVCTKNQPPPPTDPGQAVEELKIDGPKDVPVPLTGADPRRARLVRLLDLSGDRIAATAEAERSLRDTLAAATITGARASGDVLCKAAGCLTEVAYENLDAFLAHDRALFLRPESPFHKWRGSNGRTAPRREGNRLVATWYALLPPDEARIRRFKETKGYSP